MKRVAITIVLLSLFFTFPSCTLFLNDDETVFVGTWESGSGSVWEFKRSGAFTIPDLSGDVRWKVNSSNQLELIITIFSVLLYGAESRETVVYDYTILSNDEIQLYYLDGSPGSLLTRIE